MRLSRTGRLAAFVPALYVGTAFGQDFSVDRRSTFSSGASFVFREVGWARRYADVSRSTFNRGYVRLRLSLEHKF